MMTTQHNSKKLDNPVKEKQSPSTPVESNLAADFVNMFEALPDEDKRRAVQMFAAQMESYSGPLPHPEYMRKYEETLPGACDRIFKIAEKEQDHRIQYDNRRLEGVINQAKRGQSMGFVLCAIFGLIAFGMAYLGYPTLAGVIGSSTIVALAIVFVLNREPRHNGDSDHNKR